MKRTRHKITFSDDVDAACVALAQLGQGDAAIIRDLQGRLTPAQIGYRLHKAKTALAIKAGLDPAETKGFRRQWNAGESPLCQRIKEDMLGILRTEIKRTLPRVFAHPTPEVSPKGKKGED